MKPTIRSAPTSHIASITEARQRHSDPNSYPIVIQSTSALRANCTAMTVMVATTAMFTPRSKR